MKSFAVSVFFSLMISASYAQCPQKIELLPSTDEGKITFRVTATGPFEGKLTLRKGTDETTIRSFSGYGTEVISVNVQDKNGSYRVKVDFRGEEKFLCRQKVKIVDLTSSK